MIPLCQEEGIGLIPWSPLARGYLTRRPDAQQETLRGKSDAYSQQLYSSGDTEIIQAVCDIAERRGVRPAQVALAWMLAKPHITAPIIGATKMGHLEDALSALDLHLTEEEIAELERPYTPHPVRGHA